MSNVQPPKFNSSYKEEIRKEISSVLERPDTPLMYDMIRYFFGWLDEDLKPAEVYGGKQYRSATSLG